MCKVMHEIQVCQPSFHVEYFPRCLWLSAKMRMVRGPDKLHIPSKLFFFFFLLLLLLLLSSHAGMFVYIFKNVLFWNTISFFLTRSSTTPSRNFTTSPKLSSNASPTVTNGDSNCSPGYTLNNSTSSSNRQGTFSDLLFLPSLLLFIETLPLMDKYWQSL